MFKLRQIACAAVLLGFWSPLPHIATVSFAVPPQVPDASLAGVQAAEAQAQTELHRTNPPDSLVEAWIDYFEGIQSASTDPEVQSLVAAILESLEDRLKPEPVEYVRVCDLSYGQGFYYIPGTETVIKCPPRDRSGGLVVDDPDRDRKGTGFYGRVGLGGTFPLDDVVLEDFDQAAGRDEGPAGLFEIGLNWQPSNFDVRFFTGFQAAFVGTDVDSFRNLLLAGSAVAAAGNADFRTALAILGAQVLIAERWAAHANVGLGAGWLDFDLTTGGGTASASGRAFAGQVGLGIERFVTNCLAIGLTGYLTWMNGVSGTTGGGTPFQTGPLTNLALLGVLTYEFGGLGQRDTSCR